MNNYKYAKNEKDAIVSFDRAVSLLGKYNVLDLWGIASQLSCIDFYSQIEENNNNIFFPILNFERISMLCKAILASSARDYKSTLFNMNELGNLFNYLNDATYFDPSEDFKDKPRNQLIEFFAKIANAQFRFQGLNIKNDLARSYLLYDVIPKDEKDYLQKRHKNNFVDIPTVFRSKTGLSIKEYLTISFTVFAFYYLKYMDYFKPELNKSDELLEGLKNRSNPQDYIFKKLQHLIYNSSTIRDKFFMSTTSLILKDSDVINEDISKKYLLLVSKQVSELGKMYYLSPYRFGSLSLRLSPLERYPIIATKDKKYIVPNLRYFDTSIEGFIHYEMQDLYPDNQFNETFGSIFEKYVSKLVFERSRDCTIIPEISYKKKEQVEGPDLSIISPTQNYLVVVEIKSKKFSLKSRISPVSSFLEQDLQRIYSALGKLPDKIDDLYCELPEYAQWQSVINNIPRKNIICVIVVSGSLFFLAEVINTLRLEDSNHFLNNYPYKYVIISINNFEFAMELSYHKKSNLFSLLSNYWETSREPSPKNASSELFGGLSINTSDHFLNQYTDELFKKVNLF